MKRLLTIAFLLTTNISLLVGAPAQYLKVFDSYLLCTPYPAGGSIAAANPYDDVFRVCVSPEAAGPRPYPNYAFIREARPTAPEALVKQDATHHTITNGDYAVSLSLDAADSGFALTAGAGKQMLIDCRTPRSFAVNTKSDEVTMQFPLLPGQQAYGLGEWGECFARIPGHYEMWNTDDSNHQPHKRPYCNIPVMMFSPAAEDGDWMMLFVNNPGRVTVDLGLKKPGLATIKTETGDMDLWMICGTSPDELMQKWTEITGRIKRPPLWALGFNQCRWSYMSIDEVLDIAKTFREKSIPLDTMWLDIDYMEKFKVFTWNKDTFSTAPEMIKQLKAQNVHLVVMTDPGIKIEPNDEIYESAMKADIFVRHPDGTPVETRVWPGQVHHPDFTNPVARQWWGDTLRAKLTDIGVDGLWNDMNEPACFGQCSCDEFPGDAIHFDDGCKRPHKALHNIYGLSMTRASHDGLAAALPDRRPFVLTRAGWAGTQRYAAVWTGDNRSTFGSMPYDIEQMLSLGICGVPFVGSDIGGFIGNPTPELMVRWTEHGIFAPFCRAHTCAGTARQEPWSFGPDAEAKIKKLIELRYRLLPYLQDAFTQAAATGRPIMRPLVYDYPQDITARTIGNQFMFGNSILVAPVLDPGVSVRGLYLPDGLWYNWWTNEKIVGGKWITADAPLGQPPVYAKSGSVIAMTDTRQHTQQLAETLRYRIFPGDKETSTTYTFDDGVTLDYLEDAECFQTVTITPISGDKGEYEVTIDGMRGEWQPPYKKIAICVGDIDQATLPFSPATKTVIIK